MKLLTDEDKLRITLQSKCVRFYLELVLGHRPAYLKIPTSQADRQRVAEWALRLWKFANVNGTVPVSTFRTSLAHSIVSGGILEGIDTTTWIPKD